MKPTLTKYITLTLSILAASTAYPAVDMQMVTIGNVGNPGDANPAWDPYTPGAVNYQYNIGTYEVTVGQYVEFLNAVATSDPYALGTAINVTRSGSDGAYTYSTTTPDLPVTKISIYSAMRFVNWLTTGDTETGVYALNGVAAPEHGSITRNNIAYQNGGYAIPTLYEWYKAAFYQPASDGGDTDGYWDYATSSNTAPAGDESNYVAGDDLNPGALATVGYSIPNYYGTYDQMGNAFEWTETIIVEFPNNTLTMGGSYTKNAQESWASTAGLAQIGLTQQTLGFRIVQGTTVPEPETAVLSLAGLAFGVAGLRRWRKAKQAV